MANISKLLNGSPDKDDLLWNLEPTEKQWTELKSAQTKIRTHLTLTFAGLGKDMGGGLDPRFYTQGSAAYRTLNQPARAKQQIDLDDGTYLRMSTLQTAPKPSIAAAAFFEVIDRALEALAKAEGWAYDATKLTCGRLIISPGAHIDVPLYAIPDAQYETLAKAARQRFALAEDAQFSFMDAAAADDDWTLLPSEKVLLAHREDDWKASDPRQIHRWFTGAVTIYGEQLRRISRYLKAWRDLHPQLDNTTSILLMVCVWQVFKETGRGLMPKREDMALAKVAQRLPELLDGAVINPATDDEERLDLRYTAESRRAAVLMARDLRDMLDGTIQNCHHQAVAVGNMQRLFGVRIPSRPDLVVIESAAQQVLVQAPKVIVAAPAVGKSTSG